VGSFEVLSMVVSRTSLSFVLCFLMSVLWQTAAARNVVRAQANAASDDADVRARRAFEAGRDAYDHGSFTAALAHFEQAYTLRPSPELLYNVGRAADSDGQPSRAIAAYSAYLEAYPSAENRDFVHARLDKMRALERTKAALPTVAQSTPSEPGLAVAPNAAALARRRDDEPARPVWKRAWFWTTAGVLVAGGVLAGVLAARPADPQRATADEYVVVPGAR
jgi:tetratricopeptide (TPR) repeat protein